MKMKKLLFTITSSICITCMCPTSILAITHTTQSTASDSITRADKIDWQYRTINGTLYRRLYNYSTNTPLSDWEIVT